MEHITEIQEEEIEITLEQKQIIELQAELKSLQGISEQEKIEELQRKIEDAKKIKSLKRLVDLTGEAGLDGISNISIDIGIIMEDKEVCAILEKPFIKNESTQIRGLKSIISLVPLIAKKHRQAFANILSQLTGAPKEEILTYRLDLLITMTTKILTADKDLVNLFRR